MKQRYRMSIISIIFCMVFVLTACSSGKSTQTSNDQSGEKTANVKQKETVNKDNFPNKPITLITPYAPGGGFDAVARQLAASMTKTLGVPVTVKNVTGGGQRIGAVEFQRANDQGYTLFYGADFGLASVQLIDDKKQDYDVTGWKWVGSIRSVVPGIVVAKNSPYKTVEDLYKETKPLRIADPGVGGGFFPLHVILAENWKKTNISFVTGFAGTNELITALMRGEADFYYNPETSSILKWVKSGDVRVLALLADKRLDSLPDVPTFSEYPNIPMDEMQKIEPWHGLAVSGNTPDNRIEILRNALNIALQDQAFQKWAEKSDINLEELKPIPLNEFSAKKKETFDIFKKHSPELKKWAAKMSR